MHGEVIMFVAEIRMKFPEKFSKCRVLELGSQNINGSVRIVFSECDYVGVDSCAGNMVDVVCEVKDYDSADRFDTVVTTELLEHDPDWKASISNGWRLLNSGGLLVGTCAGPDRPVHNQELGKDNYYKNISEEELKEFGECSGIPFETRYARGRKDLQFWALKP